MLWAFPESEQDIRLPDTEQTGTSWTDRGIGWQAQAATRKGWDRRGGVKAGKRWEREPGHRFSLVPGITASIQVTFDIHQAHACAGDSSTALPGPGGETGTLALPSPKV